MEYDVAREVRRAGACRELRRSRAFGPAAPRRGGESASGDWAPRRVHLATDERGVASAAPRGGSCRPRARAQPAIPLPSSPPRRIGRSEWGGERTAGRRAYDAVTPLSVGRSPTKMSKKLLIDRRTLQTRRRGPVAPRSKSAGVRSLLLSRRAVGQGAADRGAAARSPYRLRGLQLELRFDRPAASRIEPLGGPAHAPDDAAAAAAADQRRQYCSMWTTQLARQRLLNFPRGT